MRKGSIIRIHWTGGPSRLFSTIFYLLMAVTAALLVFCLPVQGAETDRRIESSAQQSYVFRTYLKDDEIKILSRHGAVTLTGIVNENFHKSLAQEAVAGLPGVKSVENRLEVKGSSPNANSNLWLRDKVMVALLFRRSVSAVKTVVEVKDGIVTLRGEADSPAQKELTTDYARDVEGVKNVINEMTIPAPSGRSPRTLGEKIDDASITAQVNLSLLNHRSTSVLNTTVKTKAGVVRVGGKVRNSAEKNLVTRLVNDINGVKRVENRMTIEKSLNAKN